MKLLPVAILGFYLTACSDYAVAPQQAMPAPKEIVDLGVLITESTPEEFWGRGFINEMGYTESNSFEVIQWEFGPVSGSNSYYRLFNHGGPHVDAPNHVGLGGGLDSYAVESFAGPLKVFDFSELAIGRSITEEMLVDLPIAAGDVVLIYTGFPIPAAEEGWPEAVALTYEAAMYLAAIPIRAIGTDAYNVESMTDQSEVPADDKIAKIIPGHYAFLSKNIPVFEQLVNIEKLLDKTNMYFVGAPLNIEDGDGMMVRPLVLVY